MFTGSHFENTESI